MNEFDKKDFGKILKREGLEMRRWMKLTDSNVARVYDRNLEAIPVTVELYDSYARIVDFSDDGFSDEEIIEIKDIVSRFLYVEASKIIFKERKKRDRGEQHEKGDESVKLTVKENGLVFECELALYADTGLFLDQVNTRTMVMENVAGKKVLNLFCYTSSFSVYAAQGGAESVTSVDLSNVYSQWSRRNLTANGFLDEGKYNVVTMDASAFLDQAIERGDRYDIIIFDPPAFSNSHKAEDFDVQKDYLGFLSRINALLSDKGAVVFAENLQGFRFEKGKLEPYFKVREITGEVHAEGFSKKRKSCRVWILEKTANMKRIERAVRKRKMENLKDESLDRLTLAEEDGNGREERRERRSSSRGFDFDERKGGEREERPRRDTHHRDHERRRDRSDRRDSFEKRGERRERDDRRSYRDRDERRSFDRDERRSFRDRDERRPYDRDERRSYRDRDERRPYDREERRSYRDRDERRPFDRDERRFSRDRDERRPFDRDERRFSRERDERRSFDRDERRSFRDRDDRKDFRRDSFRGEERRSFDRGDNETSRFYRSDREDRAPRRDRDGRKKSSPKPYGYDSFMATKNREKATAFWLQNQEVAEDRNDN